MKKFLILIIALASFTGCVRSVYEVTYVDMACPTDTLRESFTVSERFTFSSRDTQIFIKTDLIGLKTSPIPVYKLTAIDYFGTHDIHESYNLISVISFRYLGRKGDETPIQNNE